jgi:hypothetical protein
MVNWDVSIALNHALIRVGSDALMMRPQYNSVKDTSICML